MEKLTGYIFSDELIILNNHTCKVKCITGRRMKVTLLIEGQLADNQLLQSSINRMLNVTGPNVVYPCGYMILS